MPRQRFFNLAPGTRERFLGIATKHFARHGFERASLNAILSEAGLSKGSYYYYFDDKDDLFATALESAFDTMAAKLPMPALDALTAEEFWPTVERFVWKWAAAFDASSDIVQAALQLSEAQRKSPRFAPMLAKGHAIYRRLIEPGQRLGCIRTDLSIESLGRLLEANDAVLDGVFISTHRKVTRASLDAHVRLVFDTFKRLLVVDPFGAAKKRRKTP
jgi:AcrR family transcriptional regulator